MIGLIRPIRLLPFPSDFEHETHESLLYVAMRLLLPEQRTSAVKKRRFYLEEVFGLEIEMKGRMLARMEERDAARADGSRLDAAFSLSEFVRRAANKVNCQGPGITKCAFISRGRGLQSRNTGRDQRELPEKVRVSDSRGNGNDHSSGFLL